MKASRMELKKQIQRVWSKPITPEMMEQAKTKLHDQFMLVGINERFNDFVSLLAQKLGWTSIPEVPMMAQRTPSTPPHHPATLSPETVECFQEHNNQDYELYTYARQLFQQQWVEFSTS